MKNVALLFCIICTLQIQAQNSISGHVTEENSDAIFYATVALYESADSTFITAVTSEEDGSFTFEKVADGNYYIEANMLGFKTSKVGNLIIDGKNIDGAAIILPPDINVLSTVEITERLPLLEQKADKMIVNVENNMVNTNGSVLDIMKKVPGLLVVNDRLSMPGVGSPTILLNGKSTQYMDMQSLLRDMPGDNIKKVEIIHQPGAEYEAAGSGPIINIIMKKNSLFGTNGNISVGVGRGTLWDYNTGLNISHYAGKLNITGGIGYAQNAYIERLILVRRLNGINNTVDGTYNQNSYEEAKPVTYRGNVRVDYDVTEKHRVGIETKYYNNDNKYDATNTTNVDLRTGNDYVLETDNDINRGWEYSNINPYYIFEIDTSGQKLEFDANFARFTRRSKNTLTSFDENGNINSNFRYDQPGDNKIFATGLDYTLPLTKIFDLKIGGKYSTASLDNNAMAEFQDENGVWKNNPTQSNHYLFDEDIYAGYAKLEYTYGDWSGTAGLRYESSKSVGNSLTIDSILTRDINQLFPSFAITKKFGALAPTLSYSYRIDRPRYSSLNPFVYFIDPFTYSTGNPNLRPELTHSAKFSLSYEGQPFFNIEYRKSQNAIVEVTQQEADSEAAFKTDVNFDDNNSISGTLLFPLTFLKGMNGYGGVIVTRNEFNSFYADAVFKRAKWNTTAFIQIEYQLPFGINSEIGGWYTSGQQDGIFQAEYMYGSSIGFSKKIMDNKGRISLGVEDPFNRFFNARVDYQQDMDITSEWQAPVVSAKFSYKFGNQHLKSKKKVSSSASEEVKRAQ